ncbi:uncharacterized protein [Apostichopus japonicus]|uniref:uncharacterized protein isoform X2 n=1 Tax=Stichopus japonicus TaxID=307972 RepID=UPI003AB595D6
MAFKGLCQFPDWSDDNIKWYMLSNEEPVGRMKFRKPASPGRIFQVDYDHTEKYGNDGIELKSCFKGQIRVKWRPGVFYGLDDELKDILITVEDLKERLRIFEEHAELLLYAKQLKIGDKVDVRVPVKNKTGIVQGTVKHIGPKDTKTPGKYFGIQLDCNLDDSVCVNYSWCEGGNCVLVAVNKIQLPLIKRQDSKPRTRRDQKPSEEYTRNDDADIGVKDAVKPPYIMADDAVFANVRLTSCPSRKQWVKGKVVFVRDNHLAVNVDSTEGRVLSPWRGVSNGKKVFTKYTSQTALVDRNDVESLHDKPLHHENSSSSSGPSNKKQSGGNSDRKSYPGIAQQVEPETKHQLAGDGQCEKEDKIMVWHKKGKKPNQHKPGSVEMSSMASGSDYRIPPGTNIGEEDRCTSDTKTSWTTRITNLVLRAEPPPYPFSVYEVQAIVTDSKLCHGLISALELEDKWRASTKREQNDFFKLESVLQSWWKDIHEGHHTHLQSFLILLGQYGREDIRDHIEKVPDRGCFDETVLNTVILSVTNSWKRFVAELGVKQHELTGKLTQDMNPYDCLRIVFDIWNTNKRGCNKLGQLLKACRAIGRDTLADEIEQGLSEYVLRRMSHQIETKQLRLLGEKLRISDVRLDAFREKFTFLSDRVYRMFSYWSMLQSFDANKIEMVASVLYDIGLGHVAEKELYKGLRQYELEKTAALLSDNWQKLAPVLVKTQDIDYIMEQKGDSSQNCFKMLSIWRGRQIQADDVNLKDILFQAMCQCNLYREARQLYYGLDPDTVMELSAKLLFDWPLLASSFGYNKGEIAQRMRGSDQAEMALKMLNEWLCANKAENPTTTKEKLLEGFVTIRREDLVEWLQNRDDGVCEVRDLKQTAKKATPESKRLTRMNMQKVAEKLHLNQQQLMDMLTLNHDDLKRYKPDSVKGDILLAVIVAWKKKNSQKYGELEAFEKLKNLLEMYDHREALAELSDGSSVDPPEVTNRSEGAVGGVPPEEPPYPDLTLDSLVEVNYGEQTLSGVIAWIGEIKGIDGHGILAGVELDNSLDVGGTDGTFNGTRCFNCHYGRGLFLPLNRCKPDSRFLTEMQTFTKKEKLTKDDFGGKDCEPVEGQVEPPKNVELYQVGMFKGIQGDHNSCYMDVTLFSMFAYNSVFDAILLYDESTKEDILEIKNVLRRTIVNPLRSIGYVRADYVLHFRDMLSGLSSMKGLRTEEKDPEEFIHALLQELLNAKPFLQISQGQNDTMESFVYQIFLDKKDNLDTSTVSDLLHLSFLQSDLKLAKVPECLIIQLPRYGKKYKLYDWIIPSLEMDINALIRDSPRQCSDCGKLAFIECKDCTPVATDEDRDVIQSFCRDCYLARHKRKRHRITNLSVPLEVTKMFQEIAEKVEEDEIAEKTQHLYPKHRMELFSVVCIETSHYVAFVKTGSGDGEQWVFFDSMADRQGDQHGYNIPEVVHLKNFRQQMESDSLRRDMKRHDFSKYLKRLLSDAYICFYRPVKNRASSHMDTNSQTTHVRSAQGNGGSYSESNQSILQPPNSLGHTDSTYQNTFNQEPTSQQVPQKSSSNQRIEPEERRVMSQGFGDRALSSGQQYDNRLYDQVANISTDKGTHQNTRYEDEIISQTTHVRSAQGNDGHYSESNQSILQPPHSLSHTDSTYQNTFNQEPTSQQVPQKSSSNQRIEPEERRVMSQGFGDRALSHGQQHDNRLYGAGKVTHQNASCADEITDENRMDWESSENRGKCDSSQQSGGPSYYRTPQHSQNSGHLKDHGIDQQSRNDKSNQNIGQLSNNNSDRDSSYLSQDTRVTGVNQSGSRSVNIRSQGVSTEHEYENLKGQRSNSDMETSQQQTSTYPTSTYPPNQKARNKHRNEQQDERWTRQTTPGNSFTTIQDSPGSSTNYRKTAPSHSQRDGFEVNMTQNIHPQCDSMSPHASLNRDQAGSSKGKSLLTPDEITSKTSQGNQSKGEMKKNSEDDRSGNSQYSELRIDSSASDDVDMKSYYVVHLHDTSLAGRTDF